MRQSRTRVFLCTDMCRTVWTVFLSSCVALMAAAQEVPPIRHFPPRTYGGQNQNWSLTQGASGTVYAGNNSGMLAFDGVRWHLWRLPEGQTVRAVAAGPGERIFCGGFAEFGYWQPDSVGGMVYHSLSQHVRAEQLEREEIWHILVCETFVLFQSFSTLYKYDYKHAPTVLRPPGAIMFAQKVGQRVLLPVIGRGVYELLPDHTFRFVSGTEPLANATVQFMVPGSDSAVWVGTAERGIFELRGDSCRPWPHPLNTVLRKSQLNRAVPLREGGWAIGTILQGVFLLDKRQQLRFHLHRENGLQDNTVLALLCDRSGHLWVGMDRGIDLVAPNTPVVFYTDQGGKIGVVYAAALWSGRLYLGTNRGLFVQQGQGFQLMEGSQGQVWELRAADGQLLCGHNSGTFAVGVRSIRRLSNITGGWCTVRVPHRDAFLLQSTYTGLVVYERTAKGEWQLSHRVEGFSDPLRKIAFDRNGSLWGVHPNRGLYRLRLSTDLRQVLEYRLFRRGDSGLPADYALDLAVVGGQIIITAQMTPLQATDSAGQVVFRPLAPPNLPQKWLCDAGEGFFFTDGSSVSWQTPASIYTLPAQLVPGYERIEFLGADEYLLCLEDGYARLRLQHLATNRPGTAPLHLQYVETPLRRLPASHSVDLSHAENDLRIAMSAPQFDRPPRFRWQLERPDASPLVSTWSETAEIMLDDLSPGTYRLRVEADTGGAPKTLDFRIRLPWYRTPAAMGAYAALLALALWLFEKISQARLLRQRQRLEAEKQQELARQRIAAERERFALELLNKNRELSNAALSLVRKNEMLQHLRERLQQAYHDPNALRKLVREIDRHLEGEHDWALFEAAFNQVHDAFFKRLMAAYPQLTPGDLRLAAYLKLNLSSKEIAPLLNISVRGVENKRYRLRKKLGLPEEANLTEFILNF